MTFKKLKEKLIKDFVIYDLDYSNCMTSDGGWFRKVYYDSNGSFITVTIEQFKELEDIVINNRKRCVGFRRY